MAIIIGHIGSDAGYTILNADGTITHVPGWREGEMEDFVSAAQVVQHASRIKAPGVGAEVVKGARAFLEKQIEAHVKSNPGDRVVLIVDD
jgi:hypothetical protein